MSQSLGAAWETLLYGRLSPGEVCDPIGYEWFHVDGDRPRHDGELPGMRLICMARKANFLLDVPPDTSGRLPREHVESLVRLQKNVERLEYVVAGDQAKD